MLKESSKAGDKAVIRPGLVLDTQASGVGNGLVVFNNELVSVYGTTLGFSPISDPPEVTDRALSQVYDTVTIGGWDGTQFVGVGDKGNAHYSITSSDGITWAEHLIDSFVLAGNPQAIWDGTQWLWFPSNGTAIRVYTSSDGVSWSGANTNLPYESTTFAFGNGVLCAVPYNSANSYTSTDGVTWTVHTSVLPSVLGWGPIAFLNNAFYMIELDPFLATASDVFVSSADGISWTSGTMLSASFWLSMSSSNDVLFATSLAAGPSPSDMGAISADDGATWTQFTLPSSSFWGAFGNASGFYTASGNGAELAYSIDGLEWDSVALSSLVGSMAGNSTLIIAAYTAAGGVCSITPIGRGIPALTTITGDRYDFAQGTI